MSDLVPPRSQRTGQFYIHPDDGLIYLERGGYWGDYNRVSNFWYWVVVTTGELRSGYGGNMVAYDAPVGVTAEWIARPGGVAVKRYTFDTRYGAVDSDGYIYEEALF